MEKQLVDYLKRFIDLQLEKDGNSYYGSKYASFSDVNTFLKPVSRRNKDVIYLLPYEDRVELAKIYIDKFIDHHLTNGFNYYNKCFSIYSNQEIKTLCNKDGYDCYVDVSDRDEYGYPTKWITKTESFYQHFLDGLYRKWDSEIETYKDEGKQKCIESIFEFQLSGTWFYYNGFKENFLKVYLEYLKSRGYKINIFEIFKKKIDIITKNIEKGTSHYTKDYLFQALTVIFDFYMAILDVYGENNKKVINKLQCTLNYIFKENLNVEKLGFMNTFLYTKYYSNNNNRREYKEDVEYFWSKIYNDNLNPTLKKIFLNALIYTWNKSPLPKVRNSIQLIVNLSTYSHLVSGREVGFPYKNQSIFYKDLIMNANSLKKSVKMILFSKAITQEGGLYLGG